MRIGILRTTLLTAPLVMLSAPLFSQTFSGPKEIPLGKPPGTFVNLLNAGDFNNDGKTDLLLGIFEFDHTANEPLNHMVVLTGKGGGHHCRDFAGLLHVRAGECGSGCKRR
jgi:hypothetical protein